MKLSCYKKALITGASSPLGEALAEALAHHGLLLLLTARDHPKLLELKDKLSSFTSVSILPLDLTHPLERTRLISCIQEETPDLVINNAGAGLYGPALLHTIDSQLNLLELNSKAALDISLHAAKTLLEHKKQGTIVNISSAIDGLIYPTFSVYAASKACMSYFSRGLDEELKPYGIRVLTSAPGQIATHFQKNASKGFFIGGNPRAISTSQACQEILWQICHDKSYHVFPKKTWLLRTVAQMLPSAWRYFLLKKVISHLYQDEPLR